MALVDGGGKDGKAIPGVTVGAVLGKHGGDRKTDEFKNQGDHITLVCGTTGAPYLRARLARDAPDILQALARGEYKSTRQDDPGRAGTPDGMRTRPAPGTWQGGGKARRGGGGIRTWPDRWGRILLAPQCAVGVSLTFYLRFEVLNAIAETREPLILLGGIEVWRREGDSNPR
jgi:hypothetical protein